MNTIITSTFRAVFDREYCNNRFEDKILIQKATYLLENLGLDLGNFLFLWDKIGPYSFELKVVVNDELEEHAEIINFSSFAVERIQSLKKIINVGRSLEQTDEKWLETVCSMHYLKNHVVYNSDVKSEMISRKPQYIQYEFFDQAEDVIDQIDNTGCFDDCCYQAG